MCGAQSTATQKRQKSMILGRRGRCGSFSRSPGDLTSQRRQHMYPLTRMGPGTIIRFIDKPCGLVPGSTWPCASLPTLQMYLQVPGSRISPSSRTSLGRLFVATIYPCVLRPRYIHRGRHHMCVACFISPYFTWDFSRGFPVGDNVN